jgi:hypothetical protein
MILFPRVQSLKLEIGFFSYNQLMIHLNPELKDLKEVLESVFLDVVFDASPNLVFIKDAKLKNEGYLLNINAFGIQIHYHDYSGALYGLMTLVQIISQHRKKLPYLIIEDYPELSVRGVMIDIARDKIPTLDTLKQLINNLMRMKINHVQLYVEGYALEYPSFKDYFPHETPLTLEEFQALEGYCLNRGIDLVGNMNSFGHMTAWLALPSLHHLAECEDGFIQWGFPFLASTLNPLDEKSVQFVKQLYQDFMPFSKSQYFNINGDEPFELGRGKSKDLCEKIGLETVYINFVNQLLDEVKKHHKTPLMWADVLINHPENANQLPQEVILIDWGYDRHYDFESHAKKLHELNRSFILAPGTSTWNSFTGRFNDMLTTTKNAAINAKLYQGLGVLTTDWGDNGHLQYLPWSYIGFAYLSQSTWSHEYDDFSDLSAFLNFAVLGDFSNQLTQAMIELSKYNDLETKYVYNATTAFQSIMYVDPTDRFPFEMRRNAHAQLIKQNPLSLESLKKLQMSLATFDDTIESLRLNDPLLKQELLQTSNLLRLGILVNAYLNYEESINKSELLKLLSSILEIHPRLWLSRNKSGGLNRSLSRLEMLKEFISQP